LKSFYCLALLLLLSLSLLTSMVWANATDNQQVDKPVKPVATISRFAKLKNTKPWYQHFNLVVSPEFSGNHFSGEEVETFPYSYYTAENYTKTHTDERLSSLQAMLGGQIKSHSIYARVGYAKTDRNEIIDTTTNNKYETGVASLHRKDKKYYEGNDQKVELTLFGQHQFTHFLHLDYELYRESHELNMRVQNYTYTDCTQTALEVFKCTDESPDILKREVRYDYSVKGVALGGRIDLGARYDYNQTQLTINYGYSHERYRGAYFGNAAYTKLGHHIELTVYHLWQYGLSTELSLGQVHEDANYPQYDPRIGSNMSQRVSFVVKKLVAKNAALSLNYTSINFSDHRQNYNFASWFLRLDYQFSTSKPPRRRKRHNNLMRVSG
jgi:hypothetical protein